MGKMWETRGKEEKERAKWERAEGRNRKIERENVCNKYLKSS